MNLRPLFAVACLLGGLLLAAPGAASQSAESIITAASVTRPLPADARQVRAVQVDVAQLERAAEARRSVVLDLLPGFAVTTSPERVERRGPGRFTWFGAVAGGGRATLTVEGAHVVARVVTPRGLVMIEPWGEDHVAFEPPPDLDEGADDAIQPPEGGAVVLPPDELFPDELHLALFYTSRVADSLGAGVGAFMQATTDALTDVLANSAVPIRARLVLAAPVVHEEPVLLGDNLYAISEPGDGQMDEVHALRDAASADMVALLVETGTNSATGCGVAYLMTDLDPSFEAYAFSVTKRRCAIALLVFPHEAGHNLGLHHDTYVQQGPGLFEYSHGFVNLEGIPQGQPGFRTPLAYESQCLDAGGTCPRIPYYSNPEFLWDGKPMGDAETADNAATARVSAPFTATFRAPQRRADVVGSTAGGPTWTRPTCPDPADLSTCVPSGEATAVAYAVTPLRVTRTGRHYVRSEAAFEGVLLLYDGAFDPARPLDGLVGYAEPDPDAPPARRLLLPADLVAARAYVLVTTGQTNADAGAFTNAVFGPVGGTVVVAAEEGPGAPEPPAFVLGAPTPNPSRASTRFTLTVAHPQRVEVVVLDVLGRQVAVLHDGPLAAGVAHAFTFGRAGTPPGVYVVQVRGERFTAAQRVTRVR